MKIYHPRAYFFFGIFLFFLNLVALTLILYDFKITFAPYSHRLFINFGLGLLLIVLASDLFDKSGRINAKSYGPLLLVLYGMMYFSGLLRMASPAYEFSYLRPHFSWVSVGYIFILFFCTFPLKHRRASTLVIGLLICILLFASFEGSLLYKGVGFYHF